MHALVGPLAAPPVGTLPYSASAFWPRQMRRPDNGYWQYPVTGEVFWTLGPRAVHRVKVTDGVGSEHNQVMPCDVTGSVP